MKKSVHLLLFVIFLMGVCSFTFAQTAGDVYSGHFTKQAIPQGHSTPLQYDGIYQELWNNGPLVTHPAGGYGGADASVLQSALGMSTYGPGAQISAGNSVADDFTIDGSAWNIEEIDFFAYQTGSGPSSSINDARFQIFDGQPNAGGNVVYGNLTTNVITSTNFSNIYRALDTDILNNQRPIMQISVVLSSPINLAPGTYWIEFQFGGTLASGPWVPLVTVLNSTGTGNAIQNQAGTWVDIIDVGPQDVPFIISGQAGPPCPVEAASNPDPANGTTGVSVNLSQLSWTNGNGAVANEVYFGTAGNLTMVQSGSLSTSWSPASTLDYNTNYYWKVVEVGDTCNSSATVWSFQTEQNPNIITNDFYPQSADYWTGTTDGSNKTDVSEVRGWDAEDGWFMFDISSIPSDAVIDSIRFFGYVNSTNYPYWSATPLPGLNPLTASASDLKTAIQANSGQGVAYIFGDETSSFTTGWHNYPMETMAVTDLQAALLQGWFAMGMDSRDNSASYNINWDGWNQTNIPYIRITYHTNGGGTNGYFEDFEGFTAGQQLACQDSTNWTTWSQDPCNTTEDPYISSNHSWGDGSSNSVVIAENNDLVKPLGGQVSGKWYISYAAYIPSGKTGYFNTLSEFFGAPQEWGMECYFNAGGQGQLFVVDTVDFTWPENTWFQVEVVIDLDIDQAQFFIGTGNPLTLVDTWEWSRGGTMPLKVDANDFFGAAPTDEMYLDYYYFDSVEPPVWVPVNLTGFTAAVINGNVILNWSTASETNNRGFEIQKNSGNSYEVLGFVQGNGTSTRSHNYSFKDKSVEEGNYSYRLKQVDLDGTSTYSNVVEIIVDMPKVFSLEQNYPNPFNPATQINFSLAVDSKVSLKIFNILGQEVSTLLNNNMSAGSHQIMFNAANLPSGVYIYKIEANGLKGSNFRSVRKMILTK